MASQPYNEVEELYKITHSPSEAITPTDCSIDPSIEDWNHHILQLNSNQNNLATTHNSVYEDLQHVENGDTTLYYHKNPAEIISQLAPLPHQARLQRHHASTFYPDPSTSRGNEPYYWIPNQGMQVDETAPRTYRSTSPPFTGFTTHHTSIPLTSYEEFQVWARHANSAVSNNRMNIERDIDQVDRVCLPEHHHLNGDNLCEDNHQADIYDDKILQLGYINNNLLGTPAQAETQIKSFKPSNLNVDGYAPTIFSEEEYKAKLAAKFKQSADSDYPRDDPEAQMKIVKSLFKAFKTTENILDKQQVANSFISGKFPDEEIEMVCWRLMLAARSSQVHPLTAPCHGVKYAKCTSFSKRIELIVDFLSTAKSICKQLVAASYFERVADCPEAELKKKKSNIKLNRKKTGQNKAGQAAISARFAQDDGNWIGLGVAGEREEQVRHFEEDEERPRKRTRRSRHFPSSSR